MSEKNDVLQLNLGYNSVNWFVEEVVKLENKTNLFFKQPKEKFLMTQEDEEQYTNGNVCWFYEKDVDYTKVRGHCHLTGTYRGPAHGNCKIIVKQKFIEIIH